MAQTKNKIEVTDETPLMMVTGDRFELSTCRLGGGRSIHLSYPVPGSNFCIINAEIRGMLESKGFARFSAASPFWPLPSGAWVAAADDGGTGSHAQAVSESCALACLSQLHINLTSENPNSLKTQPDQVLEQRFRKPFRNRIPLKSIGADWRFSRQRRVVSSQLHTEFTSGAKAP